MTLNLADKKLLKKINDRVKSGQYASADHVLIAAMASLEYQESAGDFEPGELDALCRVGLAELERGEGLDGETALRELAAKRKAATAALARQSRAAKGTRRSRSGAKRA